MRESTGPGGPIDPIAPRAGPGSPGASAPRSPRYRLDSGFLVLVAPEGGLPFAVSPRDLSRTGIGFYAAASPDVGAACAVTLRGLDGALVTVPGRVSRLRRVRTRLYEVGVRLDPPIDMGRFVQRDPAAAVPVIPFGQGAIVSTGAPAQTPAVAPPDQAAASPYDRVADLADAMHRIAEEQGPIGDLHAMVEELVRLCESARRPGTSGASAGDGPGR